MKLSGESLISGIVERFNVFFENREPKEKSLIVGFLFILLLAGDFFVLVRPVIGVFTETIPNLRVEKTKLHDLEDDLKRAEVIANQCVQTREKVETKEKLFIAKSEIPSLLENLSKLAQNTQVKIITLKPLETQDAGSGFVKIPIRISAIAATHDLGAFLAELEGGATYFRVTDFRIGANAADERRHIAELSIEAYAKNK